MVSLIVDAVRCVDWWIVAAVRLFFISSYRATSMTPFTPRPCIGGLVRAFLLYANTGLCTHSKSPTRGFVANRFFRFGYSPLLLATDYCHQTLWPVGPYELARSRQLAVTYTRRPVLYVVLTHLSLSPLRFPCSSAPLSARPCIARRVSTEGRLRLLCNMKQSCPLSSIPPADICRTSLSQLRRTLAWCGAYDSPWELEAG